ncbi:MAG: ferrous iron transport protein B [Desulfuromonas thiophila]|nr:ferrous iron transport protein B [Desulfuromonas thiophila]
MNAALIALAGQPNCGKSTLFNLLTGARQHVANYPGVTVDKMTGWLRLRGETLEVVDLPGTYSLSAFSAEERVSRDFVLQQRPQVLVNVIDASNLRRSLYLTLQLLEVTPALLVNLNMMDVAQQRGIAPDPQRLSQLLGVPVVTSSWRSGRGKAELLQAVQGLMGQDPPLRTGPVDYGPLEGLMAELLPALALLPQAASEGSSAALHRYLALKLLEADEPVARQLGATPAGAALVAQARQLAVAFETAQGCSVGEHLAHCRYQRAQQLVDLCQLRQPAQRCLSDRVDDVVCHRLMGPLLLVAVIWLLYYLSIVQGYRLTQYTWPLLAGLRSVIEGFLPAPGFVEVPLTRAFVLWFVDSVNALLNYIPVFFILFGLIALLEDSGYMPRMAFIMDRLLHRFGLHGQSTLPLVLGGVYVGGCAVPAVMSCKGIPDERARLATILTIPLLNCLAKVPLYVLLINIYFAAHKGVAMFFIATISFLLVLPIAKLLSLTVLRHKPAAPFVMEMPPYHLPTLRAVLGRALERVWLFVRKITTIVAAVAVVLFVLLQFPALAPERHQHYQDRQQQLEKRFYRTLAGTPYAEAVQEPGQTLELVLLAEGYAADRLRMGDATAVAALNAALRQQQPVLFDLLQPENAAAKKAARALKKLLKERKALLRELRAEQINNSLLGQLGQALEPLTAAAGFNWRVNVALLSAFAAKESSVATLGALYLPQEDNETLEQRMAQGEEGFTALHALALMLFMVLYPPCLATAMAVKLQTGSLGWMLFSLGYPMVLGLLVASLVFTGGSLLGLSGLQAMMAFYLLALLITTVVGLIGRSSLSS